MIHSLSNKYLIRSRQAKAHLLTIALPAAVLIFSLTCPTVFSVDIVARYGQSVRGEVDGIDFLLLRGTRQEQGEAHGVLVAKDILGLLNNTLIPQVEKQPGAWDAVIIPMVRRFSFPEQFAVELEGLFRGLQKALPDRDDRKLKALDREIGIEDLQALNCVNDIMSSGRAEADACSSFSVWGSLTADGAILSARNLDYTTFPGEVPFLVIAREPAESGRLATLDLSGPGLLGVSTAMNAEGIVLLQHDEQGLPGEATAGFTPRLLVNRDAIERLRVGQDPVEIARLFSNQKTITGTNTHISFPSRKRAGGPEACVVEWDGNALDSGATIRLPDARVDSEALFCTNHYLRRRRPEGTVGNSQRRMTSLVEAVRRARSRNAPMEIEKIKQALHTVAASGESVTYLTAIAFPDQRRIVFATTPGPGVPATQGQWIEVSWEGVFQVR